MRGRRKGRRGRRGAKREGGRSTGQRVVSNGLTTTAVHKNTTTRWGKAGKVGGFTLYPVYLQDEVEEVDDDDGVCPRVFTVHADAPVLEYAAVEGLAE